MMGGRFSLAMGAGTQAQAETFGIPWKSPASRLRDSVALLKDLWMGKQANHDGEYYKVKNVRMPSTSPKKQPPGIWILSNSPLTLRVTGEFGDGWLPSSNTPETYKEDAAKLDKISQDAGRPAADIKHGYIIFTFLSSDESEVRKAIETAGRGIIRRRLESPFGLRAIQRAGFDSKRIREEIPASMIEKFLAFGSPDQCISTYEKFIKAGVDHLVPSFVGSEESISRSLSLLTEKVLPYFE